MTDERKEKRIHLFLNILFLITILAAVGIGFWKYYYTRNYDFRIEAPCDPKTEQCSYRDCSIDGDCPPNNLSYYKAFFVKSYDFQKCSDNSCEKECKAGTIECRPISCEDEETCAPKEEKQVDVVGVSDAAVNGTSSKTKCSS